MNVQHAATALFLAVAVACAAISCAGMLAMRTTLQRLHFVGPVSVLGTVFVALAVAVSQKPFSAPGLKAEIIALALVLFSPVLAHQTARAAFSRETEAD